MAFVKVLRGSTVASSTLTSTLNKCRQNSPNNFKIFLSSYPRKLKICGFPIGFNCLDWEKIIQKWLSFTSPFVFIPSRSQGMPFGHFGATGTCQKPEQPLLCSLVPGDKWGIREAKIGKGEVDPCPCRTCWATLNFWGSATQFNDVKNTMRKIHVYHVCSLSSQHWKEQESGFLYLICYATSSARF